MNNGADISPCGTYRYRLWRAWSDGPKVVWIMLNPSTADGYNDDPTIRRCVGFTQRWATGQEHSLGGLVVVNLYALRATNPAELAAHQDPVGPDNDLHIRNALCDSPLCIAAWGTRKPGYPDGFFDRVEAIQQHARELGATLYCLATTKDGSPRHPLYMPKNATFYEWRRPCD